MNYEYLISKVSENHLKKYSQLLLSVFPKNKNLTKEYLHWLYAENPEGLMVGYDAVYNGEIVGHYATIPVSYLINGKRTKGLLSLNTAVHKDHRGKQLFTKLANRTYELAREQNFKFILGVANQNSTHGFVHKLGFKLIAPLKVKLSLSHIRYKPNKHRLKPFWNNEILMWRIAKPNYKYFERNNIIYYRIKGLLFAQMKICIEKQEILNLKKAPKGLTLWIGLGEIHKNLFFTIPKIFRPSPLNLIIKNLTDELPELFSEDIYFELIDFDAF